MYFFVQMQYMADLEASAASMANPEGLPLIFHIVHWLYYILGCKMCHLPFLFQHCMLQVMNREEIGKAESRWK